MIRRWAYCPHLKENLIRLHGQVVMKLWRREVVSSIPDRGTIVGRVFSPTRQLGRFSHPNVRFFQNSECICDIEQ